LKVLIVGELNPDLILSGYRIYPAPGKEVLVDKLSLTLGSASAICAMGLARLGVQVSFLGRVGRDPWGDFCLQQLEDAAIDTSRMIRSETPNTGITVSLTSSADRALITYLGAIAALRGSDFNEDALDSVDHVHISSYYLQQGLRPDCREIFDTARRHGISTSLDTGYDPAETWGADVIDVLREVDVFLPNEVELAAITGCAAPEDGLRAIANGHTLTVVKLGTAGCMAFGNDEFLRVPAFPVESVDTTGAGDSFNAGFIYARLHGYPLREAMRVASAAGAISTLGLGGTGKQATAGEVEQLCQRAAGS
jgi:sugar/nucleoside kinase (ribokinase family)